MKRRELLAPAVSVGMASVSGCLSSSDCSESTHDLYIENRLSEDYEVDIRVWKEYDGLLDLDNDGWRDVFRETVEISGDAHRVVSGVYNEYGVYRTEAHCEVSQAVTVDYRVSNIDECDGQGVTIAIADSAVAIRSGRPDRL